MASDLDAIKAPAGAGPPPEGRPGGRSRGGGTGTLSGDRRDRIALSRYGLVCRPGASGRRAPASGKELDEAMSRMRRIEAFLAQSPSEQTSLDATVAARISALR